MDLPIAAHAIAEKAVPVRNNEGIAIVDISNPDCPKQVRVIGLGAMAISSVVRDGVAYIGDGRAASNIIGNQVV